MKGAHVSSLNNFILIKIHSYLSWPRKERCQSDAPFFSYPSDPIFLVRDTFLTEKYRASKLASIVQRPLWCIQDMQILFFGTLIASKCVEEKFDAHLGWCVANGVWVLRCILQQRFLASKGLAYVKLLWMVDHCRAHKSVASKQVNLSLEIEIEIETEIEIQIIFWLTCTIEYMDIMNETIWATVAEAASQLHTNDQRRFVRWKQLDKFQLSSDTTMPLPNDRWSCLRFSRGRMLA